jgi:hypothetical protein
MTQAKPIGQASIPPAPGKCEKCGAVSLLKYCELCALLKAAPR